MTCCITVVEVCKLEERNLEQNNTRNTHKMRLVSENLLPKCMLGGFPNTLHSTPKSLRLMMHQGWILVQFLCFHACLVTVRKCRPSRWNLKTAEFVYFRCWESEWQRKHEFAKKKVDVVLFRIMPKLLCFCLFGSFPTYPLTSTAPRLCIPTFLNLHLSIAQTDSSDNSDLEDDIILSLNEWGAFGIWDRGTRQRVKTSASQTLDLQNRRQEKRRISADKVGDNFEHCQFETVGVCTLWEWQDQGNWPTGGQKWLYMI